MVTTDDGYFLTLQRIPGKRYENIVDALEKAQEKTTVLWVPGIMSDASNYILNAYEEPHMSIPYQLVEEGYDVWLTGYRGT